MLIYRFWTYERFIIENPIIEQGDICFINRKNPTKNLTVVGNGKDSFIKLVKPNIFIVLYFRLKNFLKKEKTRR